MKVSSVVSVVLEFKDETNFFIVEASFERGKPNKLDFGTRGVEFGKSSGS